MDEFLLSPATAALKPGRQPSCLKNSFRHGDYVLSYDGPGVEMIDDTWIYISGYVLPGNSIFNDYSGTNQHRLIALLHKKYGKEFIRYVKGYFVIIIFNKGSIEVFFDHTGLFRAFYCIKGNRIYLANSVQHLQKAGISAAFDEVSLCMQSLFHRVPLKYTVLKGIFKSTYGDYFNISEPGVTQSRHWDPEALSGGEGNASTPGINDFADLFKENLNNFNNYLKPDNHYITLTGGKDTRTILAVLLNTGIKPTGLTYGNSKSSDAVHAAILADACGLKHLTVCPPGTKEWFEAEADKITNSFNPEINIHRSHRFYAFSKAAESCSESTVFYTGYLGGELMAGIYCDDLIFTDFQTQAWKSGIISGLKERLSAYFHYSGRSSAEMIYERLAEMKNMDKKYSPLMRSFYGIFETGIPHHSQDVFLSSKQWRYPYPFFMDTDFLEMLFKSRYSMLRTTSNTINPFSKYKLYELNVGIQHLLRPELDNIPFGKKGSYNTNEYLKGPVYWSIIRGYRYVADRKKYPPSFIYGDSYRNFLSEGLAEVKNSKSVINDIYDVGQALVSLKQTGGLTSEKYLHRYSNLVMFHFLEQKLKDAI